MKSSTKFKLNFIIITYLNFVNCNENFESIEWHQRGIIQFSKHFKPDDLRALGNNMTKFMDTSVKPCENFYQYVCGKWHKMHPLQNGQKEITATDLFRNETMQTLLRILKEPSQIHNNWRKEENVKNYYKSCANIDLLLKLGAGPIVDLINALNGGMPELSYGRWTQSSFDWLDTITKIKSEFGIDILVGSDYFKDDDENIKIIINAVELSPIPKEYYLNSTYEKQLNEYRNRVARNLRKMGISENHAETLANDFIHLETRIYRHTHSAPVMQDIILEDLNRKYPLLGLHHYIKKLYDFSRKRIIVNSNYLESLTSGIQATSQVKIANYIHYKFAEKFLDFFDVPFGYQEREDYCLDLVVKFFPDNTIRMYYNRFHQFFDDRLIDFNEILMYLRTSFITSVSNNLWLDLRTKNKIIDKLKMVKLEFLGANNEDSYDEEYLYPSVKIDQKNFFNNTLALLRHHQKIWSKGQVPQDLNSEDKIINKFELNAYYEPVGNVLKLPIFMVQHPFYNPDYPKSMVYARLVTYLAKALSLGLDPKSKYVEIAGQYNNRRIGHDWWSPSSKRVLKEKKNCFRNQIKELSESYINYDRNKRILVEDEIFAETGAVEIAFNAYLSYLNHTNSLYLLKGETLPGFDFTNTQLFFVTYAQQWCKSLKSIDEYFKFDIIYSLANFKEFSKDFRCADGSWMNPNKNNCTIWGN